MPHLVGGAASFTDDTSLPYVPFVSIHAQVLAEACDLGWFDLLRNISGAAPGAEFKKAAIELFFSKSFSVQLSLLDKIGSQARIHIVDPRPHISGLGNAIRKWLPKGTDLLHFCQRLERSAAHLEGVRELFNDAIAQSVFSHSPAHQYLMTHRAMEYSSGARINPHLIRKDCGFQVPTEERLSTDVEPFRTRRSNIIGRVADYVSASASVFTPATDKLLAADSPARRWEGRNALCDSHAFDEGDLQQLERLEFQRDEVVEKTMPPFCAISPQPLTTITSNDSVHVQAADIAAGIARELWSRFDLVRVARHFNYVTYNSVRLTVAGAIQVQQVLDEAS